jgi:hypothetical protein
MAQKPISVTQVGSGKTGVNNLGVRLDNTDTAINSINNTLSNLNTDVDEQFAAKEAEITRINEAVMAMASAPITTPIFNDVETYAIQAVDITSGQPTVVTVPNGKTYKVGKGNLMVLRNGVPQVLANGDYIEVSPTTIQYRANVLDESDIITFIIGNATKLNYNTSITYYDEGASEGRIEIVTYTGDIARVITYTYTASGKIATESIEEDGKTTTKTFTYDGTSGKLTGVAAVVV